MIRGVFFDLDDTLIGYAAAEEGALVAAWREVYGEGCPVDAGALQAAAGAVYRERFGYGTPGYGALAEMPVETLTRAVTIDLLARFGIEGDVERLARAWAEAAGRLLAAEPGALETIAALRKAALRVGLITNGPGAFQRAKLEMAAIAGCFDAIVIDTEFGHPKPDPRIFEHAAAAAGLKPAELAFVGNSLEADVAGARAAGWTAVWYNPRGEPLPEGIAPPDHTIRALAEVVRIAGVAE